MRTIATACLAAALLAACGSGDAPDDAAALNGIDLPAADEPADETPDAPVVGVCGAPLDTNRNGIVEGAEWFSFSGFAFAGWDHDDDGRIAPAEFHACWRALGWGESAPAFETFDDDGDGILTGEEFFARDALRTWDDDGDGALGPSEWPPGDTGGAAAMPADQSGSE